MSHEREGNDSLPMEDSVEVALRYSFTAQFLRGAVLFARQAREIEDATGNAADEVTQSAYRAYVVSAVMQSVAALESEISELLLHGPGHHLGSNGIDVVSRDFLRPLVDMIDKQGTLRRYDLVLHLLRKQTLDKEGQIYESADLLVKLRNEIVHYKSKWGQEMERQKLFKRLQDQRFEKPSFVVSSQNFFPYHILSASCASWAVSTATEFINAFYRLLDFSSPLDLHKAALSSVPQVRYRNKG